MVRFEDDTGVLATATTGHLYLDDDLISSIGVDRSFWICVALTYIEFEEDSEVRLVWLHPPFLYQHGRSPPYLSILQAYKAASEDVI